ncbi:MAG: winged helix-turn-helix domain-containing protein [Candidatus Bathyarchaeota archaeon]|nr:winged helix-turn-helix domain-containing protein [Candidatus Bathyarchaeota archaeon]
MGKGSHQKKGIDRILDVLSENLDGLKFTEVMKKADLSRAMTNTYLKKLQKQGKIERTIDRHYIITKDGQIAKDRDSNVQVLCRTVEIIQDRIEKPYKSKKRYYPVIPIETTLSLTPELKEFLIQKLDEDIDLKDFIDPDIFCELQLSLIQKKVEDIVDNWVEHKIKMMKSDEREKFLRRLYKDRIQSMTKDRRDRYMQRVYEQYSTEKKGTIDLTSEPLKIENVLNFEVGLFVKFTGKDLLKRIEQKILKNRLSIFFLHWVRKQNPVLMPMLSELIVKGGYLREDEFIKLTKDDPAISETAFLAGRVKYEELGWVEPKKIDVKKKKRA